MMIESLEQRVLLSSALVGQQLVIQGTNRANRIELTSNSTWLFVNDNGRTTQFRLRRVASIAVELGGGNDFFNARTISVACSVNGGRGNDTLRGSNGNDTLNGQEGSDSLVGGNGDDSLEGGTGNDTLNGGNHNDMLNGGDGNDTLQGGGGDDRLDGEAGADNYSGGAGRDIADYAARTASLTIQVNGQAVSGEAGENDAIGTDVEDIWCGSGNDTVVGGAGISNLYGNAGDDDLTGGSGAGVIDGGEGNDWIRLGTGAQEVFGGAGVDMIDCSGHSRGLSIRLDDVANDGASGQGANLHSDLENIRGSQGDDHILGSPTRNIIEALGGNDTIDGGWASLEVNGSHGDDDTIYGGEGVDTLDYSNPGRTVTQQLRLDRGGIGEGTGIPGEQDWPYECENVIGGPAYDWIQGNDSANLLIGGDDNDTLIGFGGDDTLIGGPGADLFGYDPAGGPSASDSGAGNDLIYTNLIGNNSDGSADRITDTFGTDERFWDELEGDYVVGA